MALRAGVGVGVVLVVCFAVGVFDGDDGEDREERGGR